MSQTETDVESAEVSESKFNGTATLSVTASSKRAAKSAARQYFRDVHGSRPSKVVAEQVDHIGARLMAEDDGHDLAFDVMVADHSSGSMADSESYRWGDDA